jgi:hypothetical protein
MKELQNVACNRLVSSDTLFDVALTALSGLSIYSKKWMIEIYFFSIKNRISSALRAFARRGLNFTSAG